MQYLYDDKRRKIVTINGTIELSKMENEVFRILYKNVGVPLSVYELAKMVYDDENRSSALSSIILSLRIKLSHVVVIHNIPKKRVFDNEEAEYENYKMYKTIFRN